MTRSPGMTNDGISVAPPGKRPLTTRTILVLDFDDAPDRRDNKLEVSELLIPFAVENGKVYYHHTSTRWVDA